MYLYQLIRALKKLAEAKYRMNIIITPKDNGVDVYLVINGLMRHEDMQALYRQRFAKVDVYEDDGLVIKLTRFITNEEMEKVEQDELFNEVE